MLTTNFKIIEFQNFMSFELASLHVMGNTGLFQELFSQVVVLKSTGLQIYVYTLIFTFAGFYVTDVMGEL